MKTETEILQLQDYIAGETNEVLGSFPKGFNKYDVDDVLAWILDQE